MNISLTPLKLGYVATVDDADASLVLPYHWHVIIRKHKNGRTDIYAARWNRTGDRCRVTMHQHLLGTKEGFEIDHEDRNGLNNRRANLRFATRPQNQWNAGIRSDNSSGFKGVTFDVGDSTRSKKWKASIQCHNKRINLGRFLTAEEAATAYDEAATRLFGEFAKTNRVLLTDEAGKRHCVKFEGQQ